MWLYLITVCLLENGLVPFTEGNPAKKEVIGGHYSKQDNRVGLRENTIEKRDYQCVPLGECVFPFTYNGITYDTCTTADRDHQFWCSKESVHTDGVTEWSECACSGCTAAPECVFPFTHTNSGGVTETHASCILDDDSQYWCAEEDGTKHYCDCEFCVPPQRCVFPFTYRGVTYNRCSQADDDELWCAHSTDYSNNEYSTCERCDLCDAPPECVFPFTYYGRTYYECTEDAHYTYWCAHSQEYDGGWSNCENCEIEDDYLTSSTCTAPVGCVFPFTYNGVTYNGCTEILVDGAYNNGDYHFWCSANADFIGYRLPCDCDFCNRPSSCVFPFTFDGIVYDKCARGSYYYWCSHDGTYDWYSSDYSKCDCEI